MIQAAIFGACITAVAGLTGCGLWIIYDEWRYGPMSHRVWEWKCRVAQLTGRV